MKKKILIPTFLLLVCVPVTYYLLLTQGKNRSVELYSLNELSKDPISTNFLGDMDDEYKIIIDKVKNGETLTQEEWGEIHKERIKNLRKIDEKAARLEQDFLTKGYLGKEDYIYLTAKRKELGELAIKESVQKAIKNKTITVNANK